MSYRSSRHHHISHHYSNIIQNGDLPGCPGKWPLNECHVIVLPAHCMQHFMAGQGETLETAETQHYSRPDILPVTQPTEPEHI